ncbi:ATP-binding protein [Runella sp.]|uniref:hybrid sensor histidine kinase/response regulator transcription factor n=1 Tax=Runella sp. TaxID=1960881 RepID=UPI003D14C025
MGKNQQYLHSNSFLSFCFFLFLSAFSSYITVVYGQNFILETQLYSVKEGLSHRQVNDILEDRQGFIWIATSSGLNRFDGYSFRVWGREDGLHSDQINNIFEDAYGLIWVFSSTHVELIDPGNNKVVPFSEHYGNKIPNGFNDKVSKPILTKDSTFYWATHHGFITFHPKHGFHSVSIKSHLLDSTATFSLNFVSEKKTVWGLISGAKGRNIIEVSPTGTLLQNIENSYGEVVFVRSGRNSENLHHYYNSTDERTHTAVCVSISPNNKIQIIPSNKVLPGFDYGYYLTALAPLDNGRLVVSDYGIHARDNKNILLDYNKIKEGLKERPRALLIDRSQKVWLGTDYGLLLINFHKNRFKRYLFNTDTSKKGIACRGILEKGQELIVQTEGEIFSIEKASGAIKKLPVMRRYWYAIAHDTTENIFSGWEFGLELLRINPITGTITFSTLIKYPNLTKEQFGFGISSNGPLKFLYIPWTIFPDNKHHLWIGTFRNGLYIYSLVTRQLYPFSKYNGFDELKTAGIVSIQYDNENNIWLCATTGLYLIDLKKGVLERHWSGGKGSFYLPYDNIYHFYQDTEGVFWLATGGGGLIRWDKKRSTTQQFSRKAGLPNNTLYGVYEDNYKHLWLPSDYGIIQFDKDRGRTRRVYLPEDGITHPEFNRISHYKGIDGTLYFGGLNGVTAFHPADFYERGDEKKISLVVTNFQQFDGTTNKLIDRTGELLTTNEIVLNPNDRFLNLEFALLTFNQVDKIQYVYKINGIDNDWNYQNEPNVRLSRLPYGTHTLHIKGQAANGFWGSNDLIIKIRVLRPFYLQYWFLISVLVFTLVTIRSFYQWRTRELKQNQLRLEKEVKLQTQQIWSQAEKLRQLDTLKTRFYTNITHEFRTPLTVIMGSATEIEESEKTAPFSLASSAAKLIQRNSKNLLRLINQMLDLSKLDSGMLKIHLVQADVINYLQYLVESFYSMALEKKISLVFYPETPTLVMDFDEEKMQIIVYNLLSNALKFTPEGGEVALYAIQIQEKAISFLQLKVRDTGVGIARQELGHIFDRFYQADNSITRTGEGTGIGLALTKELVELLGGSITAESTLGKGAEFTLLLPISQVTKEQQRNPHIEQIVAIEFLSANPPEVEVINELSVNSGRPLVLIIEDNIDVITYLKGILNDNYKVVIATNGKSGISQAMETIPDIVISDIMMPEKDGYEVCKTLKEDERSSHIPIILLTARAAQEDKIKGLRAGADAYLQKPFDRKELFVLLEKLIELRKRLQQRYAAITSSELKPIKDEPIVPTLDDIFVQKIIQVIETQLDNPDLGVEQLCIAVNLSHTQVFRKLKALTGENPTLFIRKVRLQKAQFLLLKTGMNISEIAYATGFSDPNYFSRVFHEEFGKAPSTFRK